MLTDEQLDKIRNYAEYHGVKTWTEHLFTLLDEVEEIRAQREAVLAMHVKTTGNPDRDRPWLEATWCGGCDEGAWPCKTVRALGVTE